MTVLQAMCLAYVAQNHTVSQQSLWQDIGIPSSIASRNIAILSHFGVRGTPPLRLIDTVENPEIGDSACCRLLLRDGD
jgi:DNA-binding MarR family transcriptional regulator